MHLWNVRTPIFFVRADMTPDNRSDAIEVPRVEHQPDGAAAAAMPGTSSRSDRSLVHGTRTGNREWSNERERFGRFR